jgi:hypothetical protein
MVGASGEIGSHAASKSVMASGNGRGRLQRRTIEKAGVPGQAELVDLHLVKSAVSEFSEVNASVDAKELA